MRATLSPPYPAQLDKVTDHHKYYVNPLRDQLLDEGITILDKSLRSDRSLSPVRALRYYFDRTSDLGQNKELVFVSFKKGFDKGISTATISSWIKQTGILCYELSDQEAHALHQVKAHDVRVFAASKAFQSGVSPAYQPATGSLIIPSPNSI